MTSTDTQCPVSHAIPDTPYLLSGDTLVEKCCHFFDLFRLITGREALLPQIRAIAQRGVNYEDEPALYDVPIIDSAYVLIPMQQQQQQQQQPDVGVEQEKNAKASILGCLELCMYAEGSRHREEVIVTGTLGRLEAYLPENKVYSFRRPTHELWSDRSVPPPKSAVRQEVYDCSSVKEVFGIESDIPTHSGYHYSSTAVEWHELLNAIRRHETTGVWEPRVSVLDGLRAVELGLCATEAIINEAA
jgi:myo-inositol 2-dehydrogenase / D-chiro-inositol 1-dehydrogenase